MSRQSASTTYEIPAEVLEVLALPSLDRLTDDQVRGADCVWCRERLTAETAVALGEHMSPLSGTTSPMRWFPRACREDTANRAHAALFTHSPMCEQCVDEAGRCEVGLWLYRLVREGRR
ncbi:hypothetical protein [Streptomyces sp. DH24]|uniref:hypothetical protein n=1 Tax=Streptomyces sp. DH24 TaxID=3040123 RepID=UPI002441F155|nr:hypothetical protein [Streptomyces sp. DH24]MDG9717389.1 hypothetical protein [Streptomyces sp. DH24]